MIGHPPHRVAWSIAAITLPLIDDRDMHAQECTRATSGAVAQHFGIFIEPAQVLLTTRVVLGHGQCFLWARRGLPPNGAIQFRDLRECFWLNRPHLRGDNVLVRSARIRHPQQSIGVHQRRSCGRSGKFQNVGNELLVIGNSLHGVTDHHIAH